METRSFAVDPGRPSAADLAEAGRILAAGGVAAIPTETVYGLAVARDEPAAIARLIEIKGRDAERPLTVHLADAEDLSRLAAPLSPTARRLVRRAWPGPLTLVLPDRDAGFTGFRLPDHLVAREIVRASGRTIVATSANLSGERPLSTGPEVAEAFAGKVDVIVDAGPSRYGEASTVARVDGRLLEILREGVMPAAAVRRAASLSVLFVCTGNLCRSPMAEGILKAELARRLRVDPSELPGLLIEVGSAGTGALAGDPATPEARRAAEAFGADLSLHVSRPLTPTLALSADHVFTAERRHAEAIERYLPEAAGRIRPLLREGSDLPDPYRRSEAEYRRAAEEIRRAIAHIADELLAGEGL